MTSAFVDRNVFYGRLSTRTANALRRHRQYLIDQVPEYLGEQKVVEPWDMSIKELMKIPGIGPIKVGEIAQVVWKLCI